MIVILYHDLLSEYLFCGQPWETDGDPEPSFDYSELEPTLPSDSSAKGSVHIYSIICVKTNWVQQQTFNKATKDERAKLEEKYPIGNYPQFPDLRVYHDSKTGFYYELNSTRSGVWASAMVC